jgi:hyperosmotically inducible protein
MIFAKLAPLLRTRAWPRHLLQVLLVFHQLLFLERRTIMSNLTSRLAAAAVVACTAIGTGYAADKPLPPPSADKPATPPAGSETGAYLTDSAVTAKVKAALLSNKLTGISVTTDLGVVALAGTVPSEEIRQKATRIVAAIDGVRGVDYSGLLIKANS